MSAADLAARALRAIRSAVTIGCSGALAMLSPASAACPVCGRAFRGQGKVSFAGLCPACTEAIPWIRRIECPVCGRPERCGDCARRTAASFVASRSAVRYDASVRSWLATYKYRGHEALGPVLGEMMAEACRHLLAERRARYPHFRFDALVPVPLSEERLAERGFNQAEQLASCVGARCSIPVVEALRRTRNSGKQSYISRRERMRNTQGLFAADESRLPALFLPNDTRSRSIESLVATFWPTFGSSPTPHAGQPLRLLLIDDIYTTGSTIDACAGALSESLRRLYPGTSVEIYALTLARS
ncbi:ComF family protein [Paenibacillus methanolicus]|uniref:Putative amidophosphoribosyltransferase n=1 Tax=Paenibacillus methanolicus TaxID=582686 RepID=A0A5S5CAR7_9BACL|nr:ComF family protein [Paenibacillus methanolicus]TYP75718.1 putative amidophosphoribosyltransferase [Paenibacillus methanolicus]